MVIEKFGHGIISLNGAESNKCKNDNEKLKLVNETCFKICRLTCCIINSK